MLFLLKIEARNKIMVLVKPTLNRALLCDYSTLVHNKTNISKGDDESHIDHAQDLGTRQERELDKAQPLGQFKI